MWGSFNLTTNIFPKKCSVQKQFHEIYNFALPYFFNHSPTICQIKSYPYIFPIFKKIVLFFYETNKLLWYKLWLFKQNYRVTMFFKVIQYGYETFQKLLQFWAL